MSQLVGRCWCVLLLAFYSLTLSAADPVFSGPQAGESLSPLKVMAVYDDDAGKEIDPIEMAGGKPTMLVFVHQLTRPSMALTRALTSYAKNQADQGVVSAIIWLDDDKAGADAYLTRARKSLNFTVPVGISVDGGEGPGAYGLNRNVELTIVIANENKVTANFALVQPSVTEAAKIAAELAKLIGRQPPEQAAMEKLAYPGDANIQRMNRGAAATAERDTKPADELRELMRQVISPGQSEAELQEAVKAIDTWVGDNPQRQANLARMATAVLQREMGSAAAQEIIKGWKEKYSVQTPSPEAGTGR
jgi:hypothetical protein